MPDATDSAARPDGARGVRLRLTRPRAAPALAGALAILLVLCGLAELLARSALAERWCVAPSVGSGVRYLDLQLASLRRFAREGGVDCLILGNSTVVRGIDPERVSSVYRAVRGRTLRCFTFGIPALTARAAAALARILVADFHPWLLVYGTTAADYRTRRPGAADPVTSSTWVRYREGAWEPEGWLVAHSRAYQYFLGYRGFLANPDLWRLQLGVERETSRAGFRPSAQSNAPERFHGDQRGPRVLSPVEGGRGARVELGGLADLAALRRRGLVVVVVEMPIHAAAFTIPERGAQDQRAFQRRVSGFAISRGFPFWRPPADLIREGGWTDPIHLSVGGADTFSAWLGGRIAALPE